MLRRELWKHKRTCGVVSNAHQSCTLLLPRGANSIGAADLVILPESVLQLRSAGSLYCILLSFQESAQVYSTQPVRVHASTALHMLRASEDVARRGPTGNGANRYSIAS